MDSFTDHREAARALLRLSLDNPDALRGRAGQFVGGLAFGGGEPLSEKQGVWLGKLLERAGLPALEGGGDA